MSTTAIPRLPADIVQTIFDFIAGFEENPLVAQKRWITLSLVQKEWARLAIRYRKSIILPTPLSVKRFTPYASRLLSDGIQIRELRVENVTNVNDLLRKIFPLLPQTLESISIPLALLDAQEIIDLCKPETCRLEKVHLVGERPPSDYEHAYEYEYDYKDDYGTGYAGDWRKKVYVLLRIPTLLHLELANLAIESGPSASDTVPSCQIKTVHLRKFWLSSGSAGEHLAALFGDQVQHLHLTNVQADDMVELCHAFGKNLLSLKVDRASMTNLTNTGTCFVEMCDLLPALEMFDTDGVDAFIERIDCDHSCFLKLPASLRHCSIGSIDWKTASMFLERRKDPTYLPELLPSSVIWIEHGAREMHKTEVDEYNMRRSLAGPDDSAYTFALRWDDEREE